MAEIIIYKIYIKNNRIVYQNMNKNNFDAEEEQKIDPSLEASLNVGKLS